MMDLNFVIGIIVIPFGIPFQEKVDLCHHTISISNRGGKSRLSWAGWDWTVGLKVVKILFIWGAAQGLWESDICEHFTIQVWTYGFNWWVAHLEHFLIDLFPWLWQFDFNLLWITNGPCLITFFIKNCYTYTDAVAAAIEGEAEGYEYCRTNQPYYRLYMQIASDPIWHSDMIYLIVLL